MFYLYFCIYLRIPGSCRGFMFYLYFCIYLRIPVSCRGFMFYLYFSIYLRTPVSCQIMLVSLNNNMGATSGAGTTYPFVESDGCH
jgi:hypothetical protein